MAAAPPSQPAWQALAGGQGVAPGISALGDAGGGGGDQKFGYFVALLRYLGKVHTRVRCVGGKVALLRDRLQQGSAENPFSQCLLPFVWSA